MGGTPITLNNVCQTIIYPCILGITYIDCIENVVSCSCSNFIVGEWYYTDDIKTYKVDFCGGIKPRTDSISPCTGL